MLIPITGEAILKVLPARRRFSCFYDIEEHLLEDKRTSEVSKQNYLISQFDLLRKIRFVWANKSEPNRTDLNVYFPMTKEHAVLKKK